MDLPVTGPALLPLGVLFGFVFGWLLQRARLTDTDVIIGQLRLRDYTLFKVMLTAIIVGGVALYGGAGSIYGTLIGTIIMGMLGSGLILFGLNANWPELAQGIDGGAHVGDVPSGHVALSLRASAAIPQAVASQL